MIDLQGYGHFFWEGAGMTMLAGVLSMAVAILFGLAGAIGKTSKNPLIHRIADTYTVVIRGIPELVLLLLVFFGGTMVLQKLSARFGGAGIIDLNAFTTGILTLGFIYGAFATEVFRGALLAIPKGQIEAAMSCGMNKRQIFIRIKFPQMLRFAIPGLGNLWLVLLKATSLISVVGLQELTRKAQMANGVLRQPFTIYFVAALIYLAMTALSDVGRHRLEQRANLGVRRI